jgi:hypothetical protein
MLQKRFVDGEGWLHGFSKGQPHRGVFRSRPANLFLETHLYSELGKDGGRDPRMELWFSRLESQADPVIDKIVAAARSNREPGLTPEERAIWDLFLFMQWKRVPDLHRTVTTDCELDETLNQITAELREEYPQFKATLDALAHPAAKKRLFQNVRVGALSPPSSEVKKVLRARGLAILRITAPNKSFVIGNRPVVKLTVNGQSDLRDPTCELWLPVAPDVLVGLGTGGRDEKLMFLGSGDPVRQLNLASVHQSTGFASSSPALIRSLASRR